MRRTKRKYLIDQVKPTREDFLKDVVGQLVEQRINLGYTQDQVDHMMGNADRTCSKWECGTRTPSSFNLYCWAEVLGGSFILK